MTLRENEEFSTQLIAAIPDIVIRTDIHGEILFINEQGLELTGYAKEDIVGKNMFSFISSDDIEAATRNTILMMKQPLGPREYHLNLGGESNTLYEVNGSVFKKEDGEPYGMVYIVRDVSARRQAEEALRESERRLADIIDFLPIATMVIDGEGRVTAWNRAMETVTGTARGKSWAKGTTNTRYPFTVKKGPFSSIWSLSRKRNSRPVTVTSRRREMFCRRRPSSRNWERTGSSLSGTPAPCMVRTAASSAPSSPSGTSPTSGGWRRN